MSANDPKRTLLFLWPPFDHGDAVRRANNGQPTLKAQLVAGHFQMYAVTLSLNFTKRKAITKKGGNQCSNLLL
jgi:hypothetical protein